MNGYAKTFKVKDENKNNILMPFCIDNDKLLETYKTIWSKQFVSQIGSCKMAIHYLQ